MKWNFRGNPTTNGRTRNEDDFLVGRGVYPVAAIADGAGGGTVCSSKALAMFSKFHSDTEETCPMDLLTAGTWQKWVKLLDSNLLGGAQSTFCALRLERLRHDEEVIRVISARAADSHERRAYEEAHKGAEARYPSDHRKKRRRH